MGLSNTNWEYLESFHHFIQQGKTKCISISNCFAWQVAKANALAKQKGWEQFVSIQSHYNLIMREDEREIVPFCIEDNISITPYSPLVAERLARHPNEHTNWSEKDTFAKSKYDKTNDQDIGIIELYTPRKLSGIMATNTSSETVFTLSNIK